MTSGSHGPGSGLDRGHGIPRRPWPSALWAALLPLALAACASDAPPPPCPRVVAVTGAQTLVRFGQGGQDLTDVLFEAELREAALACEYDDDVIRADMRIAIQAKRGPADAERKANFSYFVAIATRDRKVLAREEFDLEIPFPGNRTGVRAVEEISQRIPLKPGQSGADYVVYVGLALMPKELRYNLENR